MSERAAHILAICAEAAALEGPARARFLDEACEGDAQLRVEIEHLLGRVDPAETHPIGVASDDPFPRSRVGPGAPKPGDSFQNYRVVAEIGSGAMGTVYRLRHQFFERDAALKVLHAHLCHDAGMVRRFLNEARAANAIRHPHIIAMVDAGLLSTTSAPYLLMEYLEGESLRSRMRRLGKIPVEAALQLAGQTASALAATHDQQIVHRDLKPENLFLVAQADGTDLLKVLDFGIAKLHGDLAGADNETQPGVVIGTPRYMSPEQCWGGGPIDHRTDVYALGVILYEMLCGVPPFGGDGIGTIKAMRLGAEPPSPRALVPEVPEDVDRAVRRAMAWDPAARFGSMRELRAALGLSAAPLVDLPTGLADLSGSSPRAATRATSASVDSELGSLEPPREAPAPVTGRSRSTAKGLLIGLAVITMGAVAAGTRFARNAGRDSSAVVGNVHVPLATKVVRVTDKPAAFITWRNDCMQETPRASDERWCAFVQGGDELWVVNTSRALDRGVRCDGTDPGCLRLSKQIVTRKKDLGFFANPSFFGQVLIFYAEPRSVEDDRYRGGVFAWYRGWSAPRRLTSADGAFCKSGNGAPVIWCLDAPGAKGDLELRVAASPDAPFVPVARIPRSALRVASATPDGRTFLYRTAPEGDKKGKLYVVPIEAAGDPSRHRLVSDDVANWIISMDGQSLYTQTSDGRLSKRPLADVSKPVDLALRVKDFTLWIDPVGQDRAVGTEQDHQAANDTSLFKLFPVGGKPPEVAVDRAWKVEPSVDLRYTLVTKDHDAVTDLGSLWVHDNAKASDCALQPAPQAYAVLYPFFANGERVAWLDLPGDQDYGDGWISRSTDCARVAKFGRSVYELQTIKDAGMLYIDDYANGRGGTLRLAAWGPGMSWPQSGAQSIETGVQTFVIADDVTRYAFSSIAPGREGIYVLQTPF